MSNPSNYHPFTIEVKAGKNYAWCTCGESSRQPFCDGSHGPTGMTPKIISFEKDGEVTLCGCKATNNPPYCDGTHEKLNRE